MGKNFWIIKTAEPAPTDGADVKLMRAGYLAELLSRQGHNVIWWTSTVNHQNKTQRFTRHTTLKVSDTLTIQFIYAPLYKRSVSLSRLYNQYITARSFLRLAEQFQRPDVILCCLPTLDLCEAALQYGKRRQVPVIIDVRDLWPDAFMKYAPAPLKPLWRFILTPLFNKATRICAGAAAIVGISEHFVNWGIAYARRQRTSLDRCFPFGYSEAKPNDSAIKEAEQNWENLGVKKEPGVFVACFFGYFGWHFELDLVIQAAKILCVSSRKFIFVLCGSGDKLEYYRKLAKDCPNVILPGWVGSAAIWTLMRISSVGLAPYKESPTFCRNMPNKSIEYMSAGLPIVSSLKGILSDVLKTYQCGKTYQPGDVKGLVAILNDLYDNPVKLHTMSNNAYKLYQEKYRAEKIYNDMAQLIEQVSNVRPI